MQLQIRLNPFRRSANSGRLPFSRKASRPAAAFLASAGAARTPLRDLKGMAARLGLAALYVKDEACFLGLNAFKGRGALWALARIIAAELGVTENDLSRARLLDFARAGQWHFVTATDGNHGAAVAFGARLLGQKATIFLPAGASGARAKTIAEQGAECVVTNFCYDDVVRYAAEFAQASNAILVQDTAWPGYEQIPAWIMDGYAEIAAEAFVQLGDDWPTHVFLQVGVGSFAASMTSAFVNEARERSLPVPRIVGLEPQAAACLHESILAADGAPRVASGNMKTMMAGLACGELSSLAWPILRDHLFASACCDDALSAAGMRLLARPCPGDAPVISGESGAIGMGALDYLMRADNEERDKLGLNQNARVLLVSTEGATDPQAWEKATGLRLPLKINADD